MAVPLVKLPLGKCENTNTNAKEFRDCAFTFASTPSKNSVIVLSHLPSTPSKQSGAARTTEN